MLKYFAILALALPLSACASAPKLVAPVTPTPVVVKDSGPLTVELANPGTEKHSAQVMRCSDEIQCLQKLTGFCPNGYHGGQLLHAGENKIVGTLFRCVTDEEKAQYIQNAEAEKVERARWKVIQEAREKAAEEEAATKKNHKK